MTYYLILIGVVVGIIYEGFVLVHADAKRRFIARSTRHMDELILIHDPSRATKLLIKQLEERKV